MRFPQNGRTDRFMEFTASLDELHSILEWIQQQLKPMGFESSLLRRIELASEEALVNTIQHAYQGRPEKVEIQVKLFKDRAEISFIDHGPPFNPLNSRHIDIDQSLEEKEIGGLGIHFMHNCVDEMRYSYTDKKNVLTFLIRSSQKK